MARTGVTALRIAIHGTVFDNVIFTPAIRGGTLVTYWLNEKTDAEGPYQFYLEWAEHPDDAFIEVAGPTTGGTLTDATARRYSKLQHSVYRIRLDAANGTYYSDEVYATGNLNRHDFLIAREIVRREYLALTKYTGTQGSYLARMQWGALCNYCSDFDTDAPTDAHCPTCYGTGFIGGYHNASTLWFGEDRLSVRTQRKDRVGTISDHKQMVRAVVSPFLTAKDIWVNTDTGERWSIEGKRELVAFRGKALVHSVEIRLIEPGNVAYDIPLVSAGSSSSSGW